MIPHPVHIYHIAHLDKLTSIMTDGYWWSDAEMNQRAPVGTVIGMANIKARRLQKTLSSHPDLHVGDCYRFIFAHAQSCSMSFIKNILS